MIFAAPIEIETASYQIEQLDEIRNTHSQFLDSMNLRTHAEKSDRPSSLFMPERSGAEGPTD